MKQPLSLIPFFTVRGGVVISLLLQVDFDPTYGDMRVVLACPFVPHNNFRPN
jgi:hypothetical protein